MRVCSATSKRRPSGNRHCVSSTSDSMLCLSKSCSIERSSERRLEIVSPGATVPPFLLHLKPQVKIHKEPASDYLDRAAGIVRTRREMSQRRLGRWFFKHRKAPEEQQRFLTFMHERQNDSFREVLVRLKARIDAGESGQFAESPLAPGVLDQELRLENDSC